MAQIVDKVCLALALILPLLAVIRWNLRGVIPGTLAFWGILFVCGLLLSGLDPNRSEGVTAFLDLIWLAFGWLPAVVYCLLIYGAKCAVVHLWRSAQRIRERRLDSGPQ